MGITATAAVLGGATLLGGIGGSMLGASATKKAAKSASASQERVAAQNNALAREFRDENTANFAPWMASGGRANALVDSFLYGQPEQGAQPAQAATTQGQRVAPVNTMTSGDMNSPAFRASLMGGEPLRFGGSPRMMRQQGAFTGSAVGMPSAGQGGVAATSASQQGASAGGGMDGYEAFQNSPYYQFPLQEGMGAINHGYAARGALQSGAAMKAINQFGQDYGAGRMNEFIGLAERQSDRGIQGASAIAGVGQNALASMSANNQNAANAMSNAAIARGNATAGMWGGIGSTIGSVAGSLMPSQYGSSYGSGPINVTGYSGTPYGGWGG